MNLVQNLKEANKTALHQLERATKSEKAIKQQFHELISKTISEEPLTVLYVQLKGNLRVKKATSLWSTIALICRKIQHPSAQIRV